MKKGSIIDKSLKFSNSTDDANSLLELIDSYVFERDNLVITMKSIDHYCISIFFTEIILNICIINPIQIKSFYIRKVKNDFNYSVIIANYSRIFSSNYFLYLIILLPLSHYADIKFFF